MTQQDEFNKLDMPVETRDVNKRFITIAATSLLALLIIGVLAAWFIYEEPLKKNFAQLPNYNLSIFPKPQLQAYPREDLKVVHAREELVLKGYGWTDRDHARLPIDRALELAAQKHLIPDQPAPEGDHAP